jgi:hypothetical protein
MADMHRTGRVGRNILDIDLEIRTQIGPPEINALADDRPPAAARMAAVSRKLRNPGPATEVSATSASPANCAAIMLGKCARVHAQRLGKDHGSIGRDIAMCGIARRLDRQPLEVDFASPFSCTASSACTAS